MGVVESTVESKVEPKVSLAPTTLIPPASAYHPGAPPVTLQLHPPALRSALHVVPANISPMTHHDPHATKRPLRPPFRKILYLRQPYPDNYVDSSFLSDLKRNVNVHPASLPHLLRQTLPITQSLASLMIFLVLFVLLSRSPPSSPSSTPPTLNSATRPPLSLTSTTLLLLSLSLALLLRLWAHCISHPFSPSSSSPAASAARFLVPLSALYLLSPALKTLTRATTSDSIWALAGGLFGINLLLGDYRAVPETSGFRWSRLGWRELLLLRRGRKGEGRGRDAVRVLAPRAPLPSTISLTCALSGSTVLASRLSSNTQVFSLLLFSFLWFGPFPLLRSSLTLRPTLFLTWALVSAALIGLRAAAREGEANAPFWTAVAALLGTSVGAPLVRGWLSVRYKDRLSGPWDVVRPVVGDGGG